MIPSIYLLCPLVMPLDKIEKCVYDNYWVEVHPSTVGQEVKIDDFKIPVFKVHSKTEHTYDLKCNWGAHKDCEPDGWGL